MLFINDDDVLKYTAVLFISGHAVLIDDDVVLIKCFVEMLDGVVELVDNDVVLKAGEVVVVDWSAVLSHSTAYYGHHHAK